MQSQRYIALRVALEYRTISGDALLVLAGIPPIDLMAIERTEIYEGRHAGNVANLRKDARKNVEEAGRIDGAEQRRENGRAV